MEITAVTPASNPNFWRASQQQGAAPHAEAEFGAARSANGEGAGHHAVVLNAAADRRRGDLEEVVRPLLAGRLHADGRLRGLEGRVAVVFADPVAEGFLAVVIDEGPHDPRLSG